MLLGAYPFFANVKEHATLSGASVETGVEFMMRVMLTTGRLVAVAVSNLVGSFPVGIVLRDEAQNFFFE